jgi:hypothetical protein
MIDVKQNIEQQNENLDSSSEDSNINKVQKLNRKVVVGAKS